MKYSAIQCDFFQAEKSCPRFIAFGLIPWVGWLPELLGHIQRYGYLDGRTMQRFTGFKTLVVTTDLKIDTTLWCRSSLISTWPHPLALPTEVFVSCSLELRKHPNHFWYYFEIISELCANVMRMPDLDCDHASLKSDTPNTYMCINKTVIRLWMLCPTVFMQKYMLPFLW